MVFEVRLKEETEETDTRNENDYWLKENKLLKFFLSSDSTGSWQTRVRDEDGDDDNDEDDA